MSTNYHTQIPVSSPGNSSTVNTPLGQLDSAIGNVIAGSNPFGRISFNAATTLTIASGSITPALGLHLVAAQTGTADDLDTIVAVNNSFLYIKADAGDTITLTSAGNLNADNVILTGNAVIELFCQNGQWDIVNSSLTRSLTNNLYCMGFEIESFSSSNTITIQPGLCASDNGEALIEKTTTFSVDLDSSGIGGIDTGSIGVSKQYFIWVVSGTSGVGAIASESVSSPTLPAGYTSHKRRIASVFTNSSSVLLSSHMPIGQGIARRVFYTEVTKAAPFQLLNEANIGQTGSRTAVDFSSLVGGVSTTAIVLIEIVTPGGTCNVFWNSAGARDSFILSCAGTGQISSTVYELQVPLLQPKECDIFSDAAVDEDLSLYVLGYIDGNLSYLGYTP